MATFSNQTIYGNVQQAETINNFSQDSALNGDLKALLLQLQTAIGNSTLAAEEKQKAVATVQTLAEVSKQPPEQQKNLLGDTLSYVKKLAEELDRLPETAVKVGETVAKIALWFAV